MNINNTFSQKISSSGTLIWNLEVDRMKINNLIEKLQDRTPGILGGNQFSKYAVLVPLVEIESAPHILFEVRAPGMRRQPGEICFPGGRVEETDRNEQHTAIRETSEELGIEESQIHHVAPLDYMVTPFGTIIYPFVGTISDSAVLRPNPSEVGEIFLVPLSFFKHTRPEIYKIHFEVKPEDSFPFHLISGGQDYNWQTRYMDEYFYYYNGKVIWGLTARILNHFMEII